MEFNTERRRGRRQGGKEAGRRQTLLKGAESKALKRQSLLVVHWPIRKEMSESVAEEWCEEGELYLCLLVGRVTVRNADGK